MVKKRTLKSVVKKDGAFVPPDGGWGWAIIFAAGFSNLSALPVLQQCGLLFRDKFERLGISSSQTTTIMNMNSALTSCVGLANGPMFKTFTYRQVSLAGATLVFVSLILTTFSYDFVTYLISFSIMYGASYGISSSANALALNTYWKNRRRLATSLSWTTTGLGPIIWPHLITALFYTFGETGAILILSGISLHSIACALLLQPVEWHAKQAPNKIEELKLIESNNKPQGLDITLESRYLNSMLKNFSAFSSQYLYNEDDEINPGYEITDPGVPMMLRANDGYFSQSRQSRSKVSSRDGSKKTSCLNSKKPSMINLLENRSRKSSTLYLNESKKNSAVNLGALAQERETYKQKRKTSISLGTQIPESEIEDCPTLKAPQDLKAGEKLEAEQINVSESRIISDRSNKQSTQKTTKSLKSFKMEGQYDEKYNEDNQSNISMKDYRYGEKYNKDNQSNISMKYHYEDVDEKTNTKDIHSNQSMRVHQRKKSNNFNYETEVLKLASLKLSEYLKERENDDSTKVKSKLNKMNISREDHIVIEDKNILNKHEDSTDEYLSFCQKVVLFFDLDLLKDFTFVNLMLGITLANFNELNFSLLTPFILGDCGKTKSEVAFFMSVLAGVDICVRFCIPIIAGKIGWDNNSFFLFGVTSMALGRVVLASSQETWVVTLVAIMIGFGKGLRTVFMALVIPTHVPLHKLPGATGIQLLTAGIVYLSLGPVVGWIKDSTSTAVTLHSLNIFTWLTALSWGLEKYIRARKNGNSDEASFSPT